VLRVLAVLVSLAPASRCTTDVVLRLAHLRLLQLILAWLAIRHRKGCGCTLCNRSGVCPSTRLCLYCSGCVRVRISSCSSSTSIKKKAPPALILVWIAPEMSFSTLRVPNWVST
jgi:hypothetical protein